MDFCLATMDVGDAERMSDLEQAALDGLSSPIAGDASTVLTCRGGVEQRVQASASLLSKRPNFAAYKCDVCDKYPIRGYRWECTDCVDFDMCNSCQKQRNGGHNPSHLLVRFKVATANAATNWRAKDKTKPAPALTQRTLSRMQSVDGNKSVTTLRSEIARLQINLPGKKMGSKKSELAMRLFETGVDTYEVTLENLKLSSEVPESVERFFLMNALIMADIVRTGTFESLEEPTDVHPAPPFDGPHMAALLCGMVLEMTHRDKHIFAWFSAPVPRDVPRYYTEIKEPMDLATLSASITSKVKDAASIMQSSPIDLLSETVGKLNLIWRNAVQFNPFQHPVHEDAILFRRLLGVCLANLFSMYPQLEEKYCKDPDAFPVQGLNYEDIKPRPLPKISSMPSNSAFRMPSSSSTASSVSSVQQVSGFKVAKSDRIKLERNVSSSSAKASRRRVSPAAFRRETSVSSTGSSQQDFQPPAKVPRYNTNTASIGSVRDGVSQLHDRIDEVERVLQQIFPSV